MRCIRKIIGLSCLLALAACSHAAQNVYDPADVGRTYAVEYGTIIGIRNIKIQPQDTQGGAMAGMIAGSAAGAAVGQDAGNVLATVGGALVGAVAGGFAQKEIARRDGHEYTVALHGGQVLSIAQEIAEDDIPLKRGDAVIVQTSKDRATLYRRVLPAKGLPDKVKRPDALEFED